MRPQRRICVVPSEVGRRNHELKAFGIGGGHAITLVHISASNPLGAGSYPHLISSTVVAHSSPGRMRAVAKVVARRLCIRTACATAGVNGVVPVKVVVGRGA